MDNAQQTLELVTYLYSQLASWRLSYTHLNRQYEELQAELAEFKADKDAIYTIAEKAQLEVRQKNEEIYKLRTELAYYESGHSEGEVSSS